MLVQLVTLIVKIQFRLKKVKYGKRMRCFGIPHLEKSPDTNFTIGDDVIIRPSVDIRLRAGCSLLVGSGCKLDTGVRIVVANQSSCVLGSGTELSLYSVLNVGADVTIGSETLIGGFCYIQTSNHGIAKRPRIKKQRHTHSKIRIGDDVWIGGGSFVISGGQISDGVVVGANSLINGNTAPYGIYVGTPAKQIGSRK